MIETDPLQLKSLNRIPGVFFLAVASACALAAGRTLHSQIFRKQHNVISPAHGGRAGFPSAAHDEA